MAERHGKAGRRRVRLRVSPENIVNSWELVGMLAGTRGRQRPRADERCMISILIPGFHPRV